MNLIYNINEKKTFIHKVTKSDVAQFETGMVHPVYSTFALARDAEWSGRLFVLDMKEAHEEGIGTGLEIKHISPALLNDEVIFEAKLIEINKNEVITEFKATVDNRIIATGKQWQKIVRKEKLEQLFQSLEKKEH